MSTIPFSQPQQGAQAGQTGMPGNTGPTMPMNYNFMPQARQRASGEGPGTPGGQAVPVYTANNFTTNTANNPFSQYTGFNLGLNSADELTKMYGPLGTAMYYYLNQGAGYNPAVLSNEINQIQPYVQQGLASLGANAGASGNRFGSAYQLGTADFLSQVNQNELGLAGQQYQHSQDIINQDMNSLLTGAGQYTSNKGGFGSTLASSLIPTLLQSLLNPNSTLGGGLADLLNLIPGINIPTGTGGGSGGGGATINIPGVGTIKLPGSGGGGVTTLPGSKYPGGSTTGGTPPTFPGQPQQPQVVWDPPNPTAGGNTTGGDTGATINAQTGQVSNNTQAISNANLDWLLQLLTKTNPNFGGPDVPTIDTGGGSSTGGADIPYVS